MKYEATVQLKESTFNRVNKLLAIQSLSEMTDHELMAAGANTHHCEGIFEAAFEDGSRVTWDLCSGSENYFDDIVWHNGSEGNDTEDITFECSFELSDFSFGVHDNSYDVHIELVKG